METKKSFIDEEAMERVLSPESLDAYIRVAKPGAWLITVALLIVVAAVIVWGFVGSMPETLNASGVFQDDGTIISYVDISEFSLDVDGSSARVATVEGNVFDARVVEVSAIPYSLPEIATALDSDWLTGMMGVHAFGHRVTLRLDDSAAAFTVGTLASVTLITAEIRPISLILN